MPDAPPPTEPLPPLRERVPASAVHAAKTAIVASGCFLVAPHLGIREAYWAAISSIIVLQGDFAATFTASRDRLIGTAIGGVLGWGCAVAGGGNVLVYTLGVALALFVCGVLGLTGAGRISAVAVTIITLLPHDGPAWLVSLHRIWGVSFGVLVGLIVALVSAKVGAPPAAEDAKGGDGQAPPK